MSKLLSTLLLTSSLLSAQSTQERVEDFLDDKFMENPRLQSVDVHVGDVVELAQPKGWSAYIVDVEAYLKKDTKKAIKQRMIWFSDGRFITKELVDMQSGESLTESVKPSFKEAFYTPQNYLFGDKNAKHKVVFFSDPLCPFCRNFVPKALDELKDEPEKFAVYYYHFPLERLHPASVTLVKAAVAAEMRGLKDVVEKLYTVEIDPREKSQQKILAAFNKAVGSDITVEDIKNSAVIAQIKHDEKVANELMVAGTPTVYLDGKVDKTKTKYKKVD